MAAFGWVFGPSSRQFLWQANDPTFVGEDFYCAGLISLDDIGTSPGTDIIRVKPDAAAEVLLSSTGYLGVSPIEGDRAAQLLLILYGEQGSSAFALLDSDTLNNRGLPPERGQAIFLSASSDGHLLLFLTPRQSEDAAATSYGLFIYDWTANAYAIVDSAVVGSGGNTVREWRPGTHDSLVRDGARRVRHLAAGTVAAPTDRHPGSARGYVRPEVRVHA